MKEIRRKLLDSDTTVVYYTLLVLDSLMKNCASEFHSEVLSSEFMGVMKNIITSSKVLWCFSSTKRKGAGRGGGKGGGREEGGERGGKEGGRGEREERGREGREGGKREGGERGGKEGGRGERGERGREGRERGKREGGERGGKEGGRG